MVGLYIWRSSKFKSFNWSCQVAVTYEYHQRPNQILGETKGVTRRVRKWGNINIESIVFCHAMLYLWDDTVFEECMCPYDTRSQV